MRLPPGAILCLFLSVLISGCCSGVYRAPIRTASGELRCPYHGVAMTMHKGYRMTEIGGCVLYAPEYQRFLMCNLYAGRDDPFISPVRSKKFPVPTTYPVCPVCRANVDAWEAKHP